MNSPIRCQAQGMRTRGFAYSLVILLTTIAISLTGCVSGPPVPEYTDPLASLKPSLKQEGPYSRQTLHVIISKNTQAAMKYMTDGVNLAVRYGNRAAASEADPRCVMDTLNQVLSSRFKTVTMSIEPAAASEPHSDLTMLFDVQIKMGSLSGQKNLVDLTGIFMDEAQHPIETVQGKGTSTIPYPAFTVRFREAVNAAFAEFTSNLDKTPKLAAFVASRAHPASPACG